uniref:Uncharacterized protein n=1 Tax=Steinernema glaseri TaxID=37863 RepID=A0A1I7ZFZ4_9BILA
MSRIPPNISSIRRAAITESIRSDRAHLESLLSVEARQEASQQVASGSPRKSRQLAEEKSRKQKRLMKNDSRLIDRGSALRRRWEERPRREGPDGPRAKTVSMPKRNEDEERMCMILTC